MSPDVRLRHFHFFSFPRYLTLVPLGKSLVHILTVHLITVSNTELVIGHGSWFGVCLSCRVGIGRSESIAIYAGSCGLRATVT